MFYLFLNAKSRFDSSWGRGFYFMFYNVWKKMFPTMKTKTWG